MNDRILTLALTLLMGCTAIGAAQNLDGRPYTPGVDADIDLFVVNAFDSEPVITHGTLEERMIMTPGDPLDPPAKGAVLLYANRFVHATLPAGTATAETELDGEQEILYILSGTGTIKAGRRTEDLYAGIAVIVPEGRSFTMTATGDEPVTMYLISEPTPDGFKPQRNIVVKDENTIPISGTTGHWTHIVRSVFTKDDGLATLYTVLTVGHAPMTIGHPHSHNEDFEEVWTAIRGTSLAFLGKQIRKQPPGTGYLIPPDNKTPHCNINTGDEQIKLMYFSTRFDMD